MDYFQGNAMLTRLRMRSVNDPAFFMAGLDTAMKGVKCQNLCIGPWMAGSSPAMTSELSCPVDYC